MIKTTHRLVLLCALCLLLAGLLPSCNSKPRSIRIAAGRQGSVYYQVGSVIADMLWKELRIPVELETGIRTGTIANCRLLLSGEV
ncbi:MAG: hypothetical protein KF690_07965, partial [Bacteroidetes bacterium]|nr:hypothetical protein [Bacteroidota bacterium]